MNFDQIPAGTFLWSEYQGKYYLKVQQHERYHLDNMVVDLETGEVLHYSYLKEITVKDKNTVIL
jgi:hypothetical protein